jgi:2-polyprenyl-6-methoxyphenol hydroxylase-like FAD-dependent oxidoreductase
MLDAVEHVDDIYFDVVSQIHMYRWSEGQVVLIGDAAACISLLGGEGTGLAMTEAYVLAGELSRLGQDYRGAFSAYEEQMRSFVAAKQGGAQKMIGFFATKTRFGLSVRNARARCLPPTLIPQMTPAGLPNQGSLPNTAWRARQQRISWTASLSVKNAPVAV